MTDLKVFDFNGSAVRVLIIGGLPWWVAHEVCLVLGLTNPTEAIRGLDDDEKSTLRITEGGPERCIISEAGLYGLILRSRKPEAKQFKRWVTHDIIPQIRSTGSYLLPTDPLEQALALAVKLQETATLAIDERRRRLAAEEQLQIAAPKVEGFDTLMNAGNSVTISQAAKVIGTSQKRLFKALRDKRVLMSSNIPYQSFLERGYFVVKEKPITLADSEVRMHSQTYVTPKGLDFLRKMFAETLSNEG